MVPGSDNAMALDPIPTPLSVDDLNPGAATDATVFEIVAPSQASYTVNEQFLTGGSDFGPARTIGVTSGVSGELLLVLAEVPGIAGGEIVVDIEALNSNDQRRDDEIRARWLESSAYPLAVFQPRGIADWPALRIEGTPVSFRLVGDMTIRDTTRPMAFAVTATLDDDTLTGTAQGTLYMRDYGFEPPNLAGLVRVDDGVLVTVELTAVRR